MGKHNKAEASQEGQVDFLGIDLSKKKLNRKALLPFIANLPE